MGKRHADGPPSGLPEAGEKAAPRSGSDRPRVIVWGDRPPERGLMRRLVDRLRGTPERRSSDGPALVRRPPSWKDPADDSEPALSGPRDRAIAPTPPKADGWDPPDLSVDEPAQEAGAGPQSPEAAPSEDEGHGPGPLYRATLQLLPGRLRPLDPDVVREEIRFVRPTGRDAVVTLGWAEGEPPDHITVNHPSVQDRHARMSFADRRWHIESLVGTHPVRVNGEAVPAGVGPRELRSGDEVRLGDASFHFVMP